ncbi:hypothetical protein A2954_01770 [Candidatus Roizmanbacteria bacterium RIFCSPLOWO2_01_FULL_37_12]|uniref:Uncharacterized protein n=1 Tax=Candidatus Roizmanbacteria bacterium RIFCSPLOWO2_01_FULL_37_12 TaxID=1802056 RepID=A0A1F7I9C8_9BACT|nr:MAG: hypothetical protein A2768_01070 [Candidatus Roizmanbacteria bacterium RIFCSPHIGHO2_01_FULL_37_16]OGK39976.1 MAG: hypothetical protein A2954_01770 [Candidatus Roizmanbacteria bacterium RIFCSPLOWO2_01_FULL_37_12]
MDLDKIKKFFTLFVAAFGLFVLMFIIYSIFIISRVAQKKEKQEIKKNYAIEKITPSPEIKPTFSK